MNSTCCRHNVPHNVPCVECEVAVDAASPKRVVVAGKVEFLNGSAIVVADLDASKVRGLQRSA